MPVETGKEGEEEEEEGLFKADAVNEEDPEREEGEKEGAGGRKGSNEVQV